MFHPRSVAVVGAKPGGMGAGYVLALQDMPFPGPIYPVTPNFQEIEGLTCYASLGDIEGPVDHVISTVPADVLPQLVEDCIAKGARTLQLYTAGFRETGEEERAKLESQLVARAREGGVRMIGPNCMGLYCPASGLSFLRGFPREPGPLAFISQSGSHAADLVYHAVPRGITFSKIVSYGNAADVDESELLEYLAEDHETEIIGAYVEGIKDGQRFFRALRKAATAKPVLIFKGGRTDGGTRAAQSHTGSLAGSLNVFDALCRQVGAIRVDSVEEMMDLAVAFRFQAVLSGPRVAIVGVGGGPSVAAADEVNESGLVVPELPQATQEALREFTPIAGTSIRNPVDSVSPSKKARDPLYIIASADNVDALIYHIAFGWTMWLRTTFIQPNPSQMAQATVARLTRTRETTGKPVVVVLRYPLHVGGLEETLAFQESCWRAGLPVFPSIGRFCNAITKIMSWQEQRSDIVAPAHSS